MKSLTRIISLAIVGLFVAAVVTSPYAQAQAVLTDEQKEQIVTNCQSIKTIMNQLHISDALLRVNRGQLYESIATKLMDRFNGRLSSNNINTDAFSTITSSYRQVLTKFRSDYVLYEKQLSKALSIDCQKQPSEFNTAVESARTLRKTVHSDVTALNGSITSYQSTIDNFLESYQQATSGVGQ